MVKRNLFKTLLILVFLFPLSFFSVQKVQAFDLNQTLNSLKEKFLPQYKESSKESEFLLESEYEKFKVSFGDKKTNGNHRIKIEENNLSIDLSFLSSTTSSNLTLEKISSTSAQKIAAETLSEPLTTIGTQLKSIESDQASLSAKLEAAKEDVESIDKLIQNTVPGTELGFDELSKSELVVKNAKVDKNIDIYYWKSGNELKEKIIIRENPAPSEIVFNLNTFGLTPFDIGKGVIYFKDKNNNYLFRITKGYVKDLTGAFSNDVDTKLEDGKLIHVLDQKWLSDAKRVYPLTIYFDIQDAKENDGRIVNTAQIQKALAPFIGGPEPASIDNLDILNPLKISSPSSEINPTATPQPTETPNVSPTSTPTQAPTPTIKPTQTPSPTSLPTSTLTSPPTPSQKIKLKDKEISFSFTDDNRDENLIIKSDQKTYFGLTGAETYFSLTNTSPNSENVSLQVLFPKDKGEVKNIWKFTENMPYEVDVPDYGPKSYTCGSKWQEIIEDTSTSYICQTKENTQSCDRLSEDKTICYDDQVDLGTTHKETEYKNDWQKVNVSDVPLEVNQKVIDRLSTKGINKRKLIPNSLKVNKSVNRQFEIKPNETQYFKMEITYPFKSSGEFYIEAIGNKEGYGILDPWWDSSWAYRKSIAITGAGTAGTNYQKQIIVNYSSGGDVTCNSHCNSDFGDIRFTASDGSTPLSYWQKSYTSSNTSTFFVKVTDNISSGNNTTIYMYYGKAGVTTTSNGSNTFDFFDDFSGDLSKWTIDPANTDKVSISSGALRHDPDSTQSRNSYFDTRLRTTSYKITDGVIEYSVYLAGSSSSSPRIIHQLGWRVNSNDFTNGYCWRLQNSAADGGHLKFTSGSWSTFGTAYNATTGNAWHTVKETVSGTTFTGYVDGGSGYSGTDSTKQTSDYLISHVHGVSLTSSSYVLVDDVRVRKYSATEPTFGTIGNEEISNSAPSAPTFLFVNEVTSQSGDANPIRVDSALPFMSSKYNDADVGDVANKYQIVVYSDAGCSSAVWDSGSSGTAITNCTAGNHCADVTFAGSRLFFDGKKYYWKMKYWDDGPTEGVFSDCTDNFTMLGPNDEMRHGNFSTRTGAKGQFVW